MKRCELCGREARMYCESDQASLCWDCDAKVHGANFLVERHPRVLLCRRCQSPTAWRATGARLSPIISACDRCTAIDKASPDGEEQDEDDVDGEDADMDEEEQEDYQVVPWRLTPPATASSSSGEESSSLSPGKATSNCLKRIRENADLSSENDHSCPFSQRSRLDLPSQTPLPSLFAADENAIHPSASSRRSNDHRRFFLQSAAPLYADSARTEGRVSSASCSPPI
ncbi:B-box zinc finger protein 21-like [Dendrobium catenatum]|uniref:B-box zinc finger protein 21-like n=1 Tax=Dendrobium catenatum TaxID=906689 RepID=UPI0009F22AF7|nr:B-box zinc finger protein 21-like [Dendrobium catenatum]